MATSQDSTKRCTKCGAARPIAAYSRNRRAPDGLCHRCKPCMAAISAQWVKDNPEKNRASTARWIAANREKARAMSADWKAANPDADRLSQARYRETHAEQVRAKNARWWRAHRDMGSAYANLRRTRKTAAGGRYSAADMRAHYAAQHGLCYYCATPLDGKYHDEHRIPVSRGGTSWPENMCCSCARCNRRKGRLTDVEFRARLG